MTAQPDIQFINPPTLATPPGYTHVVSTDRARTVYIAGQVALDSSGNVVGAEDFRVQIQQVFENLKIALTVAGATFSDVVKLNIYVVDILQLATLREVRDAYVNTQNPPASTLVEVRRLFRDDILVEVDAVAMLPE